MEKLSRAFLDLDINLNFETVQHDKEVRPSTLKSEGLDLQKSAQSQVKIKMHTILKKYIDLKKRHRDLKNDQFCLKSLRS